MANASEHFKTAAAHIKRGIEAKYNEIADLRHQIDNQQVETKRQVQEIKQTITNIEGDIARSQKDQTLPQVDRASKLAMVNQMTSQISDIENTASRERDHMNARIKALEAEMAGLNQQANSLSSKS